MIELGGNIVLEGFEAKDFTELIVVKKMVGQYARQITDSVGSIEKLSVKLEEEKDAHTITSSVLLGGKEHTASSTSNNLYMSLDTSLKDVIGKL